MTYNFRTIDSITVMFWIKCGQRTVSIQRLSMDSAYRIYQRLEEQGIVVNH